MAFLEDVPGATPVEDISDLIPSHITTRSELNEWEAANILKAVRHARLASDIFLYNNGHNLPNWPSKALLEASDIRKTYIAALQEADKGNYKPLEIFTTDLIS